MNTGLEPAQWHDLFLAFSTACAALLGLFFVALSLHIQEFRNHPLALYRALGGLQGLGLGLTISLCVLIPGQPLVWLGTELIAAEIGFLGLNFRAGRRAIRAAGKVPAVTRVNGVVGVTVAVLTVIAGISLMVGQGPGLYLVVPTVFTLIWVGCWFAWSLLFSTTGPEAEHPGQLLKPRRGPRA